MARSNLVPESRSTDHEKLGTTLLPRRGPDNLLTGCPQLDGLNRRVRSDLFYRLHVFPIGIPPLRERREDIPLLVEYFIDRYARKAGKPITTVEKRTLQVLQSYPWPGNIRELQNVIERSVIVCETATFSVDESWLSPQPLASEPTSRLEISRKFAAQEKEMIEAALRESRGRVSGPSGAAAKLGIPGSTLESKIRSLKINKNHFKTNPSADRT
jgi:DNA-binding NtrC family response regulator